MNKKMSTTDTKRPFSKLLAMSAVPAFAAAILASGLAVAGPAQAAPAPPPATAAQSVTSGNLQHTDRGTAFKVRGQCKEGVTVWGNGRTAGGYHFGARSDTDWSGTARFGDGVTVDLHANNPRVSEAYFQVGPHKVYDEAYVKHNDKCFHVKYTGTQWVVDGTLWKTWEVAVLGSEAYYTHEFIHHLDMVDGVKGTVMNRTDKTATVRVGGADLDLKPGQRMLYFDAGNHSGDRGTQVTVLRTGQKAGAFTVEAVDPSISYPKATVVTADGEKHVHHYSARDSKSYTESGSDFKITVTRQPDHKLPCIYENFETKDWAVFDIDITAK